MAELEPAPLGIEVEQPGDDVILRVTGELDGSNVEKLRSAVDEQLEHHPSRFSFDLAELNFMDTSGLAMLITVIREVDRVRILNPSPQVRNVIDRTGLAAILVMEP